MEEHEFQKSEKVKQDYYSSLKVGYIHIWHFNVKSDGCSWLEQNGRRVFGFKEVKKL